MKKVEEITNLAAYNPVIPISAVAAIFKNKWPADEAFKLSKLKYGLQQEIKSKMNFP